MVINLKSGSNLANISVWLLGRLPSTPCDAILVGLFIALAIIMSLVSVHAIYLAVVMGDAVLNFAPTAITGIYGISVIFSGALWGQLISYFCKKACTTIGSAFESACNKLKIEIKVID